MPFQTTSAQWSVIVQASCSVFRLRGYSTMATMLRFVTARRFSVLIKSSMLLQQCAWKLSALFSSKIMPLRLRHRSLHDASQKLPQKLPFSAFGQQKMTPGGLPCLSKAAIMLASKVTALLACCLNASSYFWDCEHSTIKQNKRTGWGQLEIIPAHWHTWKNTNKACVHSWEYFDSLLHWLIVMCMQQNELQWKCRPMKKHHFCLLQFGEWMNHCDSFWNSEKSTNKAGTLVKKMKLQNPSVFLWHSLQKSPKKVQKGSHHGAKSNKVAVRFKMWWSQAARAEDFCEAAVCFTVISLILQSNPEQMSQTWPPALGTCPDQTANTLSFA